MFISNSRSRWASTTALLCIVGLAACDQADKAIAPPASMRSGLSVEVQISAQRAAVGQQIAVALGTQYIGNLGGIQGSLEFNPRRLRYVGQDRTKPAFLMVNDAEAKAGKLRLAAMNASGMGTRTPSLVFEVLGSSYVEGLQFKLEEAATAGRVARITRANVAAYVRESADLVLPSDAGVMSVAQVAKGLGITDITLNTPGQYVPGLKYGDSNLSGTILLSDALDVLAAAVGAAELITGTDAPSTDRVIAANVFPPNLPGKGEPGDPLPPGAEIVVNGTETDTLPGSLTLSDALTILSEAVGIDQAIAGDEIPGRSATLPTNRIQVSTDITTNTTWTKDNIYQLNAGIKVTGGATLTIQPGTRIEGVSTAPGGALFVQRDGRLVADGTAREPILFTCVSATKTKGCWGGLVLNGSAHVNRGTDATSPVIAGRAATGGCLQLAGEGSSGTYGGCNDADSSGVLRYVRIEYAGFRFNAENELNGIAFQGVGNKTVVDFIQSHAGLDDGVEFFGGSVNVKHLVLTANEDDSFDWTEGWNGKAQYIIIQHDPLDSDKGFEADNCNNCNDALPRATPTIYNVTAIGKPDPNSTLGNPGNNSFGGFQIRRGARPTIRNAIVQNFPYALDIDNDATCATTPDPAVFNITNSIFTQNGRLDALLDVDNNNGNISNDADPAGCGSEDVWLQDGLRLNQFPATSPLRDPLNVMLPDWRPAVGSAVTGAATPPNDGFFDSAIAGFIGAVPPAVAGNGNIPWYAGWTRGWQSTTQP